PIILSRHRGGPEGPHYFSTVIVTGDRIRAVTSVPEGNVAAFASPAITAAVPPPAPAPAPIAAPLAPPTIAPRIAPATAPPPIFAALALPGPSPLRKIVSDVIGIRVPSASTSVW